MSRDNFKDERSTRTDLVQFPTLKLFNFGVISSLGVIFIRTLTIISEHVNSKLRCGT